MLTRFPKIKVYIYKGKNLSQEMTVKTLKNSLSVEQLNLVLVYFLTVILLYGFFEAIKFTFPTGRIFIREILFFLRRMILTSAEIILMPHGSPFRL